MLARSNYGLEAELKKSTVVTPDPPFLGERPYNSVNRLILQIQQQLQKENGLKVKPWMCDEGHLHPWQTLVKMFGVRVSRFLKSNQASLWRLC